MSDIVDYPVRACPFIECGAVWIEDPVMYEDTSRCPHCGRYGDDFDYGQERDLGELGGGSSREHLFLHYMTAGPFRTMDMLRVKTVGALNEAEFRT